MACIAPGDLRPERQQALRQCQGFPSSSYRSDIQLPSDLAYSPPRRGFRANHEGSLARPEHHRRAVIPMVYGIPVVAHVAFVLRFERFQFRGGLGVAELAGTDDAADRSRSFARSDPVMKLDVAVHQFCQFRSFRRPAIRLGIFLVFAVLVFFVVAPARSKSMVIVVFPPRRTRSRARPPGPGRSRVQACRDFS